MAFVISLLVGVKIENGLASTGEESSGELKESVSKEQEVNFQGVKLEEALRLLASLAGVNIIVEDSIEGEVTTYLEGVSNREAIKFLVKAHGLDYKVVDEIIIVGSKDKLQAGFGKKTAEVFPLDNACPKTVKDNLSLLLGEEAVKINERRQSLLIKTYKQKLPLVKEVINQLDKPRSQISIQASLREVSHGELKELGIDWEGIKIEEKGETLTPKVKELGIDYQQLVNLLAEKGQGSILANPQLTTVSGEKAEINIGDEVPILKGGAEEAKVEFKEIGISLELTSRVSGEGDIYLETAPEVSVVNEYIELGGNRYPVVGTRRASTSVRVKDGQTIVIGGLMSEQEITKTSKLPVLGEIPALGRLFRKESKDSEKRELVIFLTPRLKESARLEEASRKEGIIPFSYKLKEGETLWMVSDLFNLDLEEIISYNQQQFSGGLEPGVMLELPVPKERYYSVKEGDTIEKIAKRFKVASQIIKEINGFNSLKEEEVSKLVLPGPAVEE